ncbi:MAG: ferritin family protein [Burkholderiales bacterium]|nr:ferritin family protein [Burkholderiales bacterium]
MTTKKARKRAPAPRKPVTEPRERSGAYADFMAQAYTMELEAVQRYTEFAEQMEVHNNPEVAQLFRKLATIEGLHAKQILEEMGWSQAPGPAHAQQWEGGEPPESAPMSEVHYRMTPWHALELALDNELRAEKFFAAIAKSSRTPAEVRKLAAEMADEEAEHVRLVREWMKRVPRPDPDWNRDPDPPFLGD